MLDQLLTQVANQDRKAFDALYERTSAKLFGVSLRILKDRGEAQDVTQEVFMKIWNTADRFEPDKAAPMSWLITIARNHAIDRYRKTRRLSADPIEDVPLASQAPTPEAEAQTSSTRRALDLCMDELKDDHGQMIRLAYLEGYSYQELADRFSHPLNSVRTWLRRGLLSLRACLDGQSGVKA